VGYSITFTNINIGTSTADRFLNGARRFAAGAVTLGAT
jgi:hypothetical protein